MRKTVGTVTQEEKEEIQNIFNKKRGLEELFTTFATNKVDLQNNPLYDRLLKDYTEVTTKFHEWWNTTSQRYNWEGIENSSWLIDFSSNEVYLNT